mgnify:FL=1
MTNYREGVMSPVKMLQTISGICKTNCKLDWNNTGQTPEDEFRFIANMIDSYLEQQDKGSEGANQDD